MEGKMKKPFQDKKRKKSCILFVVLLNHPEQNTHNLSMCSLFFLHQTPVKGVWLCLHQYYAEPSLHHSGVTYVWRIRAAIGMGGTYHLPHFTGVCGLNAASLESASVFTSLLFFSVKVIL